MKKKTSKLKQSKKFAKAGKKALKAAGIPGSYVKSHVVFI